MLGYGIMYTVSGTFVKSRVVGMSYNTRQQLQSLESIKMNKPAVGYKLP